MLLRDDHVVRLDLGEPGLPRQFDHLPKIWFRHGEVIRLFFNKSLNILKMGFIVELEFPAGIELEPPDLGGGF